MGLYKRDGKQIENTECRRGGETNKKLIEAARWLYGKSGNEYCRVCRLAARQKKEKLDCDECKGRAPEIILENRKIFECFTLCDSQMQGDVNGIYTLKWEVIIEVAKTMKLKIDNLFFHKLRAFESTLSTMVKNNGLGLRGQCNEQKKQRCRLEFGGFLGWACKNCNEA